MLPPAAGTHWFKTKRVSKDEYAQKLADNRRLPAEGEEDKVSPKEKIDQW